MLPTISSVNFFEDPQSLDWRFKVEEGLVSNLKLGKRLVGKHQSVTTQCNKHGTLKACRKNTQSKLRKAEKARNWCIQCQS